MRPNSFWRVSSRVEDHLFTNQNETLIVRTIFWILLGVSAIYVLAFLRRENLSDEVAWILHLKGYLVITLLNAGLLYIYKRILNHIHLGPGLKKLHAKIPDEDAVPVRIRITQNGAITGVDEGFLWILEGTLYYKGRQTVFRLNREDVPPLSLWPRKERPNLALNRLPESILVPTENHLLKINYTILDSHEDFGTRRKASHFQNQLVDWLTERPVGSLESLLPPTELHPGFLSQFRGQEPLIAGIVLTSLNLTIVLAMNIGVNFSASSQGFAILCTILHLILLAFSVKFLLLAANTIKIRQDLEKNLKTL